MISQSDKKINDFQVNGIFCRIFCHITQNREILVKLPDKCKISVKKTKKRGAFTPLSAFEAMRFFIPSERNIKKANANKSCRLKFGAPSHFAVKNRHFISHGTPF